MSTTELALIGETFGSKISKSSSDRDLSDPTAVISEIARVTNDLFIDRLIEIRCTSKADGRASLAKSKSLISVIISVEVTGG